MAQARTPSVPLPCATPAEQRANTLFRRRLRFWFVFLFVFFCLLIYMSAKRREQLATGRAIFVVFIVSFGEGCVEEGVTPHSRELARPMQYCGNWPESLYAPHTEAMPGAPTMPRFKVNLSLSPLPNEANASSLGEAKNKLKPRKTKVKEKRLEFLSSQVGAPLYGLDWLCWGCCSMCR
ncbi:unnamed protein product, partial [Discosporangium mesarthrocarpum]